MRETNTPIRKESLILILFIIHPNLLVYGRQLTTAGSREVTSIVDTAIGADQDLTLTVEASSRVSRNTLDSKR
jgi:hypothetical protein